MVMNIELSGGLILQFRLLDTPLAKLWLERMEQRNQYSLDHPDKFYGFDSLTTESNRATKMITNCIDTINSYQPVITRPFTTIDDQDCLNYLHNIFERYHGLLDKQDTDYWINAPDAVKKALAELNLAVHRCESVHKGANPRFVCTWFGLPKTKKLPAGIIEKYGTLNVTFGTVYINYVEIGKTLADLTHDNDNYIADDAFKPFDFFSADFSVRFYTVSEQRIASQISAMEKYFNLHKDFFQSKGYNAVNHEKLLPYYLPVAELVETMPQEQLLKEIQSQQHINRVYIE